MLTPDNINAPVRVELDDGEVLYVLPRVPGAFVIACEAEGLMSGEALSLAQQQQISRIGFALSWCDANGRPYFREWNDEAREATALVGPAIFKAVDRALLSARAELRESPGPE